MLALIAVVAGSPYAALVLNRVMGPWSVVAHEADGSDTTTQFGQDLPRLDWTPVPSGASVVQSSHLVSKDHPEGLVMPSRLVQVHWWNASGHFATPDPREARNATKP